MLNLQFEFKGERPVRVNKKFNNSNNSNYNNNNNNNNNRRN